MDNNSVQIGKVYRIENDDYNQFWSKNSQMFGYAGQSSERFSAHQLSEQIWTDFIAQVGVSIG